MTVEVPQYAVQDEIRVDPARTALIVIDMQNDFVERGGSLLVPDAAATVPAIGRLLDFARVSAGLTGRGGSSPAPWRFRRAAGRARTNAFSATT